MPLTVALVDSREPSFLTINKASSFTELPAQIRIGLYVSLGIPSPVIPTVPFPSPTIILLFNHNSPLLEVIKVSYSLVLYNLNP